MKINVTLTQNHISLFSENATSQFSENDAYLFSGNSKKIKSTEAYENEDLTDLMAQAEKYYPLK